MVDLFVDIDACCVYRVVFSAAARHSLGVYVVTRGFADAGRGVHLVLAQDDSQAGSDWIADNISAGDICITDQIRLAAQCVLKGAIALRGTGFLWTGSAVTDCFKLTKAQLGRPQTRPLVKSPGDAREFAHRLETAIARAIGDQPKSVKSAVNGARLDRAVLQRSCTQTLVIRYGGCKVEARNSERIR